MFCCSNLSQFTRICHKIFFICSLPALHQKFDLPAPFVLHTDCPHYWRFRLPGTLIPLFLCTIPPTMLCLLNDSVSIQMRQKKSFQLDLQTIWRILSSKKDQKRQSYFDRPQISLTNTRLYRSNRYFPLRQLPSLLSQ